LLLHFPESWPLINTTNQWQPFLLFVGKLTSVLKLFQHCPYSLSCSLTLEPCFACFLPWHCSSVSEVFRGLFGLSRSIEGERCHTTLNGLKSCSLRVLGNVLFLVACT
jgi:hypothetical protein